MRWGGFLSICLLILMSLSPSAASVAELLSLASARRLIRRAAAGLAWSDGYRDVEQQTLLDTINHNCNAYAGQWTSYGVHAPLGHTFISGMNGLGGNPNHFEKLLSTEFTADVTIMDWVEDYAKHGLGMWLFLGSVAVVWLIILCFWLPAYCCRKCRKAYARCFSSCDGCWNCNCCETTCCQWTCCTEHEREALHEVPVRKTRLLFYIFLAGSIIIVAFVIVALVFGLFFGFNFKQAPCTATKSAYVMLFGDDVYENPPRFAGMARVYNEISNLANELSLNRVAVDNTGIALKKGVDDITVSYIKTLDATKTQMTDAKRPKLKFSAFQATHEALETDSAYYCLICEITNDKGILGTYNIASVQNYATDVDKELKAIDQELEKAMKDTQTVIETRAEFEPQIMKLYDYRSYYAPPQPIHDIIVPFAFVGVLILPALVLVFWLLATFCLWRVHRKRKQEIAPKAVKMKKAFGMSFCFFAIMTFLLLFFGTIFLLVSQVGSEGCHLLSNDFMQENKWFAYPITSNFARDNLGGNTYSNFTRECLTSAGGGDAMTALAKDLEVDYSTAATLKYLNDKTTVIDAEVKKAEAQMKTDLAEPSAVIRAISPLVGIKSLNQETFYYNAVFREVLYGGIQADDASYTSGPERNSLNLLLASILAAAKTQLGLASFLDDNGVKLNNPNFAIEQNYDTNAPILFGLKSQVARLNLELIAGCTDKLCIASTATTGCLLIDGKSIIKVDLTATSFDLKKTLVDPVNTGKILPFFGAKCRPPGSVAAIQWINSFNAIAMRVKAADGVTNDQFRVVELANATPAPATYARWLDFVTKLWADIDPLQDNEIVGHLNKAKNSITSISSDFRDYLTKLKLNCGVLYGQLSAISGYACNNLLTDLGIVGMSWIFLAIGVIILLIMLWFVFRYFADIVGLEEDRKKKYGNIEALFYHTARGETDEVAICCRYVDPAVSKNERGNSPLHIAAYNDHAETCRYLLSRGCPANEENQVGFSPLHVAVTAGSATPVPVLLEGGADTRMTNPFGDMPIHTAARNGDNIILTALLEHEDNSNPPLNMENETPMQAASRLRKEEAVRTLDRFFFGCKASGAVIDTFEEIREEDENDEIQSQTSLVDKASEHPSEYSR